ncbi:MAG: hypothetical protein ACKPKO_57880, partial [Candidatus Fonsibacter sp.]
MTDTMPIAVSAGADAENALAPHTAEVMADTMAIAVSVGSDADNAPPAQAAPAAPPAFVPDALYTTFSEDWFRVVRYFRRNGLAYFKLDGDVKHGYTMDGYGAVSYWHRDSEGHLTLTP